MGEAVTCWAAHAPGLQDVPPGDAWVQLHHSTREDAEDSHRAEVRRTAAEQEWPRSPVTVAEAFELVPAEVSQLPAPCLVSVCDHCGSTTHRQPDDPVDCYACGIDVTEQSEKDGA